jgi:two-component system NtrC family sensor kinase
MTIRNKLLLTMTLLLAFVTVNGFAYYRSLVTIRNRLTLVESIDDLGVAISDIRRAEKNYLLYHDQISARDWIAQIELTREGIKNKSAELTELEGDTYYRRLTDDFSVYATLSRELVSSKDSGVNAGRIRTQGQKVYNYSRGIISAERERIDKIIKSSKRIFFISILIIIFSWLTGVVIIARHIVAPLTKIGRATKQVSEGHYVPIDGIHSHDETGKLAEAFNHMIRQIEKHQDELVQAGKLASLGTLTSGVAHELNNPLNNISMIAQTYKQHYDYLSEKERVEFMSQIDAQCERAREIVDNLLSFSRVRPRTHASADIGTVIKESLKLVENQLAVTGIECKVSMPTESLTVHINANRIKQVLINLFTNAVKAMPKGGSLLVDVALSDDSEYVNITVTDTGVGIPPDVLPHIFDPFFTTSEVGRGTGLGLSVSYSILKRHGGTITVKSELGKGSVFKVALPVMEKEEDDGEPSKDTDR